MPVEPRAATGAMTGVELRRDARLGPDALAMIGENGSSVFVEKAL